jgi:GR25 family glycosyltransferase involved in LPS biosynthesis
MKTKIIVLQSSEISVSMGNKCIARAKEFGIDAEVSNGIHGADAPELLKSLGLRQYKPKMKGGRLGVLGCFLSHYFLWKDCCKDNEPYMIFEHDAYMLRPLPENILDLFTGILKLDSLDPYRKTYTEELNNQSTKQTIWSLHTRTDHGKHVHTRGLYSIGGYGYILKPQAAYQLIDQTKKYGYRPADHALHTSKHVDVHHIAPSVVRIHPEYQDHQLMRTLSLTRNLESNSLRIKP